MASRRRLRAWLARAPRRGFALGVTAVAAALLITLLGEAPRATKPVKAAPRLAARDPEIDVLLTAHDGAESARFSCAGGWTASAPGGVEIASTSSGAEAVVARGPNGSLTLRGAPVPARELVIAPRGGAALRVGKASYRGALVVEVKGSDVKGNDVKGSEVKGNDVKEKGLRLVNRVSMEAYLASVVGSEMYASLTKPGALEAQAVAARTYARFEIEKRGRTPLPDSQEAQAYYGIDRETASTRAAVAATAHQVLFYDETILPAFYHSTCGGSTIDATELLGSPAPAPLRGVECGFCGRGKYYRWTVALTPGLLGAAATEVKIGPRLLRLDPKGGERDPWASLELLGDGGSVKLNARKFRALVQRQSAAPLVPSPFVSEIAPNPKGGIFVKGKGFGHGAGLCQVGAAEMAARGSTAAEILRRYYPGAVVDSTARRGVLSMK